MKIKKVLITGGYGFIGSCVARHLQAKGTDVAIMEHPNAKSPKELDGLEVLRADITDEESMCQAKLAGVDAVLHFAAQSSGPRSFSVPVLDVKLNVLGTVNVINWCLNNQVERLLFASSFVVYGDHPELESLDEDVPCKPKSVYATSKLASEYLLMNYAQPKGIRWNSLRMFNVYGPGQDITKPDQGVVGIFMNMLLQQNDVQVKGRLDRFRDLIYIDDVVHGWDLCLYGDAFNQVFNLGTGEKKTLEELIKAIAHTMGKEDNLRIEELAGTPGDMMGCYADLARIREALGFKPHYSLDEGLIKMWNWISNH